MSQDGPPRTVNTIWRWIHFGGTLQQQAAMYNMEHLSEEYLDQATVDELEMLFEQFGRRFGQLLRRVPVDEAATAEMQPERARLLIPLRALREALERLSNDLRGHWRHAAMPLDLIDGTDHLSDREDPVLVKYYDEQDSLRIRDPDPTQPYVIMPTQNGVFTLRFHREFLEPIDDRTFGVPESGSGQQSQSVPTAAPQQTASTSSAPQNGASPAGHALLPSTILGAPLGPPPPWVVGVSQAAGPSGSTAAVPQQQATPPAEANAAPARPGPTRRNSNELLLAAPKGLQFEFKPKRRERQRTVTQYYGQPVPAAESRRTRALNAAPPAPVQVPQEAIAQDIDREQEEPEVVRRSRRVIRKLVRYGENPAIEAVRPVRKRAIQKGKTTRSKDGKKKETVKRRQPKNSDAQKGKRASGNGGQKSKKTTKK